MSNLNNNNLQFITLPVLKDHFKFTDAQDDETLLSIVQNCNLEIKKRLINEIDDLDTIEGSVFFQPASDAALVYCESEVRRQINKQYDIAKTIMERFTTMIETLIGFLKSAAPERTSRLLAARDTDDEDEYFAERHVI